MRERRQLLVDVTLSGAARSEFDQVVVAFHKGNEAQDGDLRRSFPKGVGFETGRAEEEAHPVLGAEAPPPLRQHVENRRAGHLDGADGGDAERPALLLLCDHRIVFQRDLGVEAVGEYALVLDHELRAYANIPQSEARQFGEVTVVLGVEARAHDIDQPHGTLFSGARLEDLALGRADGAALKLTLHDVEPFGDLLRLDARAVTA